MFEEKNNKQNENKTSLIKFKTNQREVVKKGRAAGGDGPQGRDATVNAGDGGR